MVNLSNNKEYITKAKQKELLEQLEHLKTVERKAIAEKLDYARELGDLSENAEYHDAREQQGILESKIEAIEAILNNAEIVSSKKSSTVTIGSTVTIQKAGSKTQLEYTIVGSSEADMANSKLSHESPLGKALLGSKESDSVTLETPAGAVKYTIKKLA